MLNEETATVSHISTVETLPYLQSAQEGGRPEEGGKLAAQATVHSSMPIIFKERANFNSVSLQCNANYICGFQYISCFTAT